MKKYASYPLTALALLAIASPLGAQTTIQPLHHKKRKKR